MTDTLKQMIQDGNWLEIAKAITRDHVKEIADKATGSAPEIDSPMVGNGGEASPKASPLYLLASDIVDIVELAEQYRLEEEAAREEGEAIEASGYPDPKYESNGRY